MVHGVTGMNLRFWMILGSVLCADWAKADIMAGILASWLTDFLRAPTERLQTPSSHSTVSTVKVHRKCSLYVAV